MRGLPVILEREGPLAILTFDAPPLNLFDAAMIAALQAAVADVAADPPRGLLIRAEGRVVSGGVDVHLFDGLSPQDAGALWTELLQMIHTVEELPLPTVFAAHSLCLAGGLRALAGLRPAAGGRVGAASSPEIRTPDSLWKLEESQ